MPLNVGVADRPPGSTPQRSEGLDLIVYSHKRRARRVIGSVLAAGMAATLLAACSGGAATSSTTKSYSQADISTALKKKSTLTVWAGDQGVQANAKAFEKRYPNITVDVVNIDLSDSYTKLQNAIKAGSGVPDAADMEDVAMPQFALAGSIVDLKQFGLASLQDQYNASAWKAGVVDGGVYGLPYSISTNMLFYNQKVFSAAGISSPPKTWDEYLTDAKKIHAANPSDYITADVGDPVQTSKMIWQAGGHPFSANGKKATVNLVSDKGVKKYTTVWNQLLQGKLLSSTAPWTSAWFNQLGNGQIASLVTGGWMSGNLEQSVPQASGDWRVAPVPTYNGGKAVTSGGTASIVVPAKSDNQLVAAAFARFATSESGQDRELAAVGGVPTNKANFKSSSYLDAAPAYFGHQKINQMFADATATIPSDWQYLPFQLYADSIYADTVGKAYSNGTGLNAALKAWQNEIVAYGRQQGFEVNGK